jgi:uncharacterized protein YjbI with pentapeptide repeats
VKKENIDKILEDHKLWLTGSDKGCRANLSSIDLRGANLSDANLSGANLSGADLRVANLRGANLSGADLSVADLSGADLRGADLRGADLRDADLRDADIDYSALPLSCGGLKIKIDKRIACQLAYHFCGQICCDAEYQAARKSLLSFANHFHRVDECGKLE